MLVLPAAEPFERIEAMNGLWRRKVAVHLSASSFLLFCVVAAGAQQIPDVSTIIRGIDSSVKNRLDRLARYTATEHYAVFRGHDAKQVADMVVRTEYRKQTGKSYTVLSENGSSFWRGEVLNRLLDNEKHMSQPSNAVAALINSSNYEMKLDSNSVQNLGGRECLLLDITPRRNSEYLFKGLLWVDAHDYSIVQLKGTAGKSAFFLASAAQVTRRYVEMGNVPMATHAEAVSGSTLLGQTEVRIDYSNYQLEFATDH